MKNLIPKIKSAAVLAGLLGILMITSGFSSTYYVATTGSDSNAGTLFSPFGTLQHANDIVDPGDTVYIRGGTYSITTPSTSTAGIAITASGSSDSKRTCFFAYNGETPVFNFSKMTISTTGYTHGFVVTGSYLYFKGLEICYVPMNTRSNCGMHVDKAKHDIFEQMDFHHNCGAGMFISYGTGGHLILNCDSHDNYDSTSSQGVGQNADGFGCHYQSSGDTTIYRGCRAWWNSDDGWDLFYQEWPVIIEDCWAMGSGYAGYGTITPADGNGNGFKAGLSKKGARFFLYNCVAWKNKAAGFYANHSSGGSTWYNNTSYSNGSQYNMLASDSSSTSTVIYITGSLAHIMRNNIGYPKKNVNMDSVNTSYNTWDLGITPATSDFISVSDPSMTTTGSELTSGAFGPRQSDGSLPDIDFLKLSSASKMIDVGTNVGISYVGDAPDLGAYEYGTTSVSRSISYAGNNKTANVTLSGDINIDNAVLFDLSGRRLSKNLLTNKLRSSVCRELRSDGKNRCFVIIQTDR